MAGSTGPNIVNNGLILNLDAAIIKSFRGLSGTNLWYNLNRTFSPSNTSTFKVSYGTEKVYIPYFNGFIDTTYCDIYNDYVGGSGQCCPSPFYYHGPNVTVSGNTQYTYQLIFKTTNGYYSTNYMYRYEFGTSGLITEQGVVNASRLESLGNGWYHAWGQFTTNASTTNITGWLFHYEYLVTNRISVAAVCLTQGSTIHRPEHLINFGFRETRGTTVATGGGWKDLSGKSSNGEIVNGITYDSSNRGNIVFDGVDDYINLGSFPAINFSNGFTIEIIVKLNSLGGFFQRFIDIGNGSGIGNIIFGRYSTSNNIFFECRDNTGTDTQRIYYSTNNPLSINQIAYYAATIPSGTPNTPTSGVLLYKNGLNIAGANQDSNFPRIPDTIIRTNSYVAKSNWADSYFSGNIYALKIYNRTLSATEILQNYNTQKSRFGL